MTGDSANDLFGVTLDPNVHIQESKVGLVRHPAGPPAHGPGRAAAWSTTTVRRAGITVDTGNAQRTPPRPGGTRTPEGEHR